MRTTTTTRSTNSTSSTSLAVARCARARRARRLAIMRLAGGQPLHRRVLHLARPPLGTLALTPHGNLALAPASLGTRARSRRPGGWRGPEGLVDDDALARALAPWRAPTGRALPP